MAYWQLVNLIRGLSILLSLLLGLDNSPLFVSSLWLLLSLVTGLNMVTSGLIGFCSCSYLIAKLGIKPPVSKNCSD
ncbi:hypothetical protein A1D23_03415 [Chelonobacter oris]|uniref:Rhodanese n=1 Tax=Chelonobacter oris TaxID=505317 RepID=A0A0A3AR12_9PAST|nr:DUF2892 domain-containing protein [Chelonobacter oris]KGQ69535.1 hypothetical protein OA57_11000 [Chelonobacter oris]MDH3001662.1 hypothetical protein [Chelonobacter oris]